MKRTSFRLKAALATLTAVSLTSLPCVAGEPITSAVSVSPSPTKLSGAEWRSFSLAGSRILKHTDQALTALADKKDDEATANIVQGLKLVEIIDAALPASTVTTDIKSGKLAYTDAEAVKPVFVPIYREYDSIDVLSPVIEQMQSKGKASTSVPDVAYAGYDYTGIKLDLRLAKRDLESAQDLITKKDTKAATAALQDILATGVIFEFSSVDQPLVRAMDNLRLADSEIKANHPGEAKAALGGASDALKNYEKLTDDTRSKEVATLGKEIDAAAKEIAQEKPETFTPKAEGWWARCRNWFGNHV